MIKLSFSTLTRIAALMVACVLVGCGGASSTVNPLTPTRVIAFGDSYSAVDSNGLGAYTIDVSNATNTTVASYLSSIYGLTLKNVSSPSSAVLSTTGAFSYAVGGTFVSGVSSFNTALIKYSSTNNNYVGSQITNFLNNNAISSKDLFIITAGTQDIYAEALGTGDTTVSTAVTNLTTYIQKLTDAGAQYVVVMLPVSLGRSPSYVKTSTNATLTNLTYDSSSTCVSFSCLLLTALNSKYPATSSHQKVLVADMMSYFNLMTGTTYTGSANTFAYTQYSIANPDVALCANVVSSCTTSTAATGTNTYTSTAYTYANSVWADNFNLTPYANQLLGSYIYNTTFYRAAWR